MYVQRRLLHELHEVRGVHGLVARSYGGLVSGAETCVSCRQRNASEGAAMSTICPYISENRWTSDQLKILACAAEDGLRSEGETGLQKCIGYE